MSLFGPSKSEMEALQKRLAETEEAIRGPRTKPLLERVVFEQSPEFSVHRIENGYLAVAHRHGENVRFSITYCKDAKELAEHIIAASARKKLNVRAPEQLDLFHDASLTPQAVSKKPILKTPF